MARRAARLPSAGYAAGLGRTSQPAPAQASTPDTPAALPAGLSEDPDDPPETALFGTVDAAAAPVWRVVAWTVGAAGLVLSLYGVSTIAQSLGQDANPLTVHGGLAFSISGVTVVALASALLELLP